MNSEYIAMCKEAKEIQALWDPKSGDLYHFKSCYNSLKPHMFASNLHGDIISYAQDKNMTGIDYTKDKFWMPRYEDLYTLLKPHFFMEIKDLLILIMEELYGKAWNGSEWEPIK